jgi:hypothetical protein
MKLRIITAAVAVAGGAFGAGHLTSQVTSSNGSAPHLCIPTTPAERAGKFCWGDPVSDMAYVLVYEGLSYTQAFCVADADAEDARFTGQFQLLYGAALDGNPAAAEGALLSSSGECG